MFIHPIYLFTIIFLFIYAYSEATSTRKFNNKNFAIVFAIYLIFLTGFRVWGSPDYKAYLQVFIEIGFINDFSTLWNEDVYGLEKFYVILNGIVSRFTYQYVWVTAITATLAVSLKIRTIYRYAPLFGIACLFYFIPIHLTEENTHIRQGVAIAFCVFSVYYIEKRKLIWFALCIYIAYNFHKTAFVFIPAYWLGNMKISKIQWIIILSLAIISWPLELFRPLSPFISSIATENVSDAFNVYLDDSTYGQAVGIALNDAARLFLASLVLYNDEEMKKKYANYEMLRNLYLFSLVIFYFFKGNEIFAMRLSSVYSFYIVFMVSMLADVYTNNRRMIIIYLLFLFQAAFIINFILRQGIVFSQYTNYFFSF